MSRSSFLQRHFRDRPMRACTAEELRAKSISNRTSCEAQRLAHGRLRDMLSRIFSLNSSQRHGPSGM